MFFTIKQPTEGFSPVVVVSAMGKTTDELVDMSEKVTFNKVKPDLREKDTLLSTGELVSATLLAMSIKSLNVDVLSLSGQQAGQAFQQASQIASVAARQGRQLGQTEAEAAIEVVEGLSGQEAEQSQ